MDLSHDWKSLNEVLFCQKGLAKHAPTLVALEDGKKIFDAVLSTGQPYSDRLAARDTIGELSLKYGVEQTVSFAKKELDQIVADAASLGTNYFQQLEYVRSKVYKHVNKPSEIRISRDHFILRFFSGKMASLLPRRFNVLVFLDQRPSFSSTLLAFEHRAILLTFDRGKLDQFFEPDFSSLHEQRLPEWLLDPVAIGKYLESRYILPCYGIFMLQSDWDQCVTGDDPWSVVISALDDHRAAIYPRTGLVKTLIAFQRISGYLSGFRR
ncbi:MAG TPA: hypothetical protein PLH57_05450 [Oligoflexia bacterium]|nr:hypothetical protein [Oligoflexia bacterium]